MPSVAAFGGVHTLRDFSYNLAPFSKNRMHIRAFFETILVVCYDEWNRFLLLVSLNLQRGSGQQ